MFLIVPSSVALVPSSDALVPTCFLLLLPYFLFLVAWHLLLLVRHLLLLAWHLFLVAMVVNDVSETMFPKLGTFRKLHMFLKLCVGNYLVLETVLHIRKLQVPKRSITKLHNVAPPC